ncbi:hypothetical protein KKF55_03450 [Patescibacteria group bacterium]|nr:hypothetical protein [Patescibacteria group bacterium]
MKKILLSSAALLLLTGCARSSLTLDLTFSTDDLTKKSILATTSENVIERMAFALEEEIPTISTTDEGDGKRIIVTLKNKDTIETLADNLSRPILFHVMRESGEDEEADIENEQFGRFSETGITEKNIKWVDSEAVEVGIGIIQINFTDEGAVMWEKVLEENEGKKVGIFARGGLVAMHTVKEGGFKDKIIIAGIPSPELAKIFADDVNVGTYVTFTRVH